jgi:trehalose 6-phosphate synthase/phosphatase
MSRLLIVANRLPVSVRPTEGGVEVERSPGGLATGLSRPHEQSGGLWIGWPGTEEELSAEQQADLDRKLAELRLVPVPLTGSR